MKGRIKMASGMSKQVYRLLLKKGFDEELSREIAFTYMNTDYTATRMLGYLYRLSAQPKKWWSMKCLLSWRTVSGFVKNMNRKKHRRRSPGFIMKDNNKAGKKFSLLPFLLSLIYLLNFHYFSAFDRNLCGGSPIISNTIFSLF